VTYRRQRPFAKPAGPQSSTCGLRKGVSRNEDATIFAVSDDL
jgi:hypothetical protein